MEGKELYDEIELGWTEYRHCYTISKSMITNNNNDCFFFSNIFISNCANNPCDLSLCFNEALAELLITRVQY